MELKVVSNGKLKNHVLRINAMGLQGSLRNAKDGMTYIGSKKRGAKKASEVINDFIVPSKNKETAKRHRGRHLQIEFKPDTYKYTIKDLGIGFGAFVKIDRELELRDNHLLNLGESFIIINLFSEKTKPKTSGRYSASTHSSHSSSEGSASKIRLKIFGGP